MVGRTAFDTREYDVDLCVVGGGLAGLCAAVAAARHGARVLLMQDRSVLGGNASSEIRMWICGAHGADNKETGILEELMLDNCYRNPTLNYPIWDTVLYEKASRQPNLTLLLNCTCHSLATDGPRITSVTGWQLTTQTYHVVRARLFADCSGDSVLRICGAETRRGREARAEFGERYAPEVADSQTMGNSVLLQLREVADGQPDAPFIAPPWAVKYHDGDLPHRSLMPAGNNFWWIEIGGTGDTVADAERNRDDLLAIAYGVWDYIKNHPDGRGRGWELEWIGSLPGKRESVRYVGDTILTQNEIEAEGRFPDMVAYGGWTMDDHHPAAIHYPGPPTIWHPAPSPYGIPYRCLYSRNIENLFFAGRNISVTHMALSSTRVMATCALLGQAVGTAAALAVEQGCSPRAVYEDSIGELQARLLDDDCYLPWHHRPVPALTRRARLTASEGDAEPLRSGVDRSLGREDNGWWAALPIAGGSGWVEYRFDTPVHLTRARFTFDSDLAALKRMPCSYPLAGNRQGIPPQMTRAFEMQVETEGGNWQTIFRTENNYQRLVKIPLDVETPAIRFVPLASWGGESVHLFAWDVL